jgi:opacity protein-like surface antigen
MRRSRNILIIAGLLAAVTTPLRAQYRGPYAGPTVARNRIGFQVGFYRPDGSSGYWRDKELEFTGRAGDFEDWSFGLDYQRFLTERLALTASSFFYEGGADQSYLDFVDEFGVPITHATTLEMGTLEVGLVFRFLSRDAPVIPYLGAAGGLYAWTLRESGDFIDFGARPEEIFTGTFEADGDTFGWSWMLGLEIPINRNWSINLEGRFRDARDELGGDFKGFGTLDLSGKDYRAGLSWGF